MADADGLSGLNADLIGVVFCMCCFQQVGYLKFKLVVFRARAIRLA